MIRDAVAAYAARFHRVIAGRHGVGSPFGAWLLLALVAPSADGAAREELTAVLGCAPDEAFAAATEMLAEPHPDLVLGSAIWHAVEVETDRLRSLVRALSPPADAGPIPAQADVDAWARDRTQGLIERFPLKLDARVVLLLATAIATQIRWDVPFEVVPAADLMLSPAASFAGQPMLRDAGGRGWRGFVDTQVGVVAAPAADPAAVLDTASGIAIATASGPPPAGLSLFDLPVGDGPAWRVTETVEATADSVERYEWILPAWEARSEHALIEDAALGFRAAGRALFALLPPGDYAAEARQAAMARYGALGFDAAAVTGFGARATGFRQPEEQRVRTARIEFSRPHAVVAVTSGAGPWNGLPVFAAWVGAGVSAAAP